MGIKQKIWYKIKADRPLTRDKLNARDYWQTNNSNRLVMVIRNYHQLNSTSRVLISTCSAPLVQMGERKQFSLFDLDLQSQISQGQGWPSCQKSRPNGSNRSAHRQTDATKRIISPAKRSIIRTLMCLTACQYFLDYKLMCLRELVWLVVENANRLLCTIKLKPNKEIIAGQQQVWKTNYPICKSSKVAADIFHGSNWTNAHCRGSDGY